MTRAAPSPRPAPAGGGESGGFHDSPSPRGRGPGRGVIQGEHLRPVHRPAHRHLAAGDRDPAHRRARLPRTAGLRAAGGRFPDHPGHDAASRRQPGNRRDADHRLARAPVRPDPRPGHHDLAELRGHQPDHAAVQPQPHHGFGRAGRAGGDQRGGGHAAGEPSLPADLLQGEPGRRTDPDARADLGLDADRHASATPPTRCCSRSCPRSTASGASPCRAGCARPCACGSIRRGSPPYGLSMEDVRTAVANANVNGAKGGFDGPRLAFALGANDQLVDADAYRDLVIAWRNGAPVRLSDDRQRGRRRGERPRRRLVPGTQPAAVLDIQRQPGANIVQTVRAGEGRRCRACSAPSRPGSGSPSSPTAPRPSAPRCATCRSRWSCRWCWWCW